MAGMKRRIIVSVVVAGLLIPYAREAWAHEGGLDRHGCHNVTATGEYHCHRGEDDEDKTTALLVAAGVVVVLVAATLYWLNKKKAPSAMLAEEMVPSRNLYIPTPHMTTDWAGATEIRAVWKISF